MAARALCRLRRAVPSSLTLPPPGGAPSSALPAWRAHRHSPGAEQGVIVAEGCCTDRTPLAAEPILDRGTDASTRSTVPSIPFLAQAVASPIIPAADRETAFEPRPCHPEDSWVHPRRITSFSASLCLPPAPTHPPECTPNPLHSRSWLPSPSGAVAPAREGRTLPGDLAPPRVPCLPWEPWQPRMGAECLRFASQAGAGASLLCQPVRRQSSQPPVDERQRGSEERPGGAGSLGERTGSTPGSAPGRIPGSSPGSTEGSAPGIAKKLTSDSGPGKERAGAFGQDKSGSSQAQEGQEGGAEQATPPAASWIPAGVLPYYELARLDKPIGTWLLAWPCLWSIALATPPGALPDPTLVALFGVGSILMRGAGCTINDILDRDIDARVERTRLRPLARGAVGVRAAVGFLGVQLGASLGVLLQLNAFSQALGAASLPLVLTYPLMKRLTDWPQAYLGLAFNWGALLGWAAVRGSLDLPVVLPLYAGGVFWTLVYDTIYAHQDKEDDAIVGVRSTARLFGDDSRLYLSGFGAATVASLTMAGMNAGLGTPFLLAMAAPAAHMGWQVLGTDFNNGNDCLRKFRANREFGALVLGAILAGKFFL